MSALVALAQRAGAADALVRRGDDRGARSCTPAAVFAFVSRSVSDSLDQRLRSDFWWAAAMVDQRPDGTVTWFEPEGFGDEDGPWLQVWSRDGELLYQSSEAAQLPLPESAQPRRPAPTTRSPSVPTDDRAGPHAQPAAERSFEDPDASRWSSRSRAPRRRCASSSAIWR